jgi:hypothetical protein
VVDYLMLSFERDCKPALQKYGSLKGMYEGIKNYSFTDLKQNDISIMSLICYMFLRLVSKHFNENNDAKMDEYMNEYTHILALNPID